MPSKNISSSSRRSSPPSSPPPSKRSRFEETDPTLDEFMEIIENENRTIPGHQVHKSRSTFRIKKFPEHPESIIGGMFQDTATRAVLSATQIKVDTIGFMINSQNLEEGQPIYSGFKPLHLNTIESLLNLFLKVEQSRKALGKSLFAVPLEIEVTVLQRKGLSQKVRKMFGGRYASKRNSLNITHVIAENQKMRIPDQKGNRCLFYALHAALQYQIRGFDQNAWKFYRRSVHGQRGKIHREVEQLMRELKIPLWEKEYNAFDWVPDVVNYWNNILHAGHYKIKVWFFGPRGLMKPMYKYGAEDYNIQLIIHWDGTHFVGLYQTGSLFGKPYCLHCEKCYNKDSNHDTRCKRKCLNCLRVGAAYPCKPDGNFKLTCQKCSKTFVSRQCYEHHISSKSCNYSKRCPDCGVIWDTRVHEKNGWGPHNCYERYCKTCNSMHPKNSKRGCFIKPYEVKPQDPCRFIAFDIETTEIREIIPPKRPYEPAKIQKKLVPNFVSARIACQKCIDNEEWKLQKMRSPCSVCGPDRTITFGTHPYARTDIEKSVICNDPIKSFTLWLLNDLPQNFNSYIFSHYGGKFDIHFAIVELYKLGCNPDLIRRGNKIITMDVVKENGYQLHFRDSFNLFPMALKQLPSAFGLHVPDKGCFPHKLNRPENFDKIIQTTAADYTPENWKTEEYERFMEKYENEENKDFYLNEELPAYCTNDTDILMAALVAFRQEFMEISKRIKLDEDGDADRAGHLKDPHNGLDPLTTSATIARACINLFKANHLPTHHLALVPERGYDRRDNQSKTAYQYLRWVAEEEMVHIQTAYSEGGEKRFGPYPVDGYIEEQNRIIEVNGCNFHGCPTCFPDDHQVLYPKEKTALWLRQNDARRIAFLEKFVDRIDIIWTCEIDRMKAANPEMKKKCEEYEDRSPLDPRECFYGGRTGPSTLFYEAKEGEKISYYDFTSLYPYVNYMLEEWMMGYPVGHPKVHIKNEEVNWTSAADNPYKTSLLKCWVVPPRQIDVPILPMKVTKDGDERLLFPLCAACAEFHPDGGYYHNYQCRHTDDKRGWMSSCTSIELDAALNEGYRVTKLIRVYEYEGADRELFRGYMKEFLALKIHATGFDKQIEGNTEEEDRFIRECKQKFGITVDRLLMKMDKGKRALAKLIVNNLWGRFAMRNWGLYKTAITDDPVKLGELFDDNTIDIMNIDELVEGNEERPSVIMVTYLTKRGFVEENDASNVVISLWTTSCARLLLLRSMQKVVRTPGCKLHYVDTDSLIFSHPENDCPLQLGPHVGDFTDELPDHDILEVCFGGPKQYGIKMRKKNQPNAPLEYMLKIRGITLNHDVMHRQGLQYDKFKQLVLKYAHTGIIDSFPIFVSNFVKSIRKGAIDGPMLCVDTIKHYKPVVSKGIVKKGDYTIYHFGQYIPS